MDLSLRKYHQVVFWSITFVVLTFSFGRSYGGYAQSFFFVSFLFPVILGTSIFFNSFLVPRYLLKRKYVKFGQYSLYALVFSVYLEILVITLSLSVFSGYQYDQMNPRTTNILFLTTIMYLLVFANTILFLLQEYFRGQDRNAEMEAERERIKKRHLVIKSDRRNLHLEFENLVYIESVGNYVRIHLRSGSPVMTKESLQAIENRLPPGFLRIHRSILVNMDHITSFNHEGVYINELELPVSRKYKETALHRLNTG
jgi:hypothetical protein